LLYPLSLHDALPICIWGGQRRLYASIKFVIYTMVGSLLMLVAIFYVYVQGAAVLGHYTTDLEQLLTVALPYHAQVWCFAAFAVEDRKSTRLNSSHLG